MIYIKSNEHNITNNYNDKMKMILRSRLEAHIKYVSHIWEVLTYSESLPTNAVPNSQKHWEELIYQSMSLLCHKYSTLRTMSSTSWPSPWAMTFAWCQCGWRLMLLLNLIDLYCCSTVISHCINLLYLVSLFCVCNYSVIWITTAAENYKFQNKEHNKLRSFPRIFSWCW